VIAPAEQDALQVAELVEQKQGMVAQAGEVAVVGGALLVAVGLAHRAVHVQDELGGLAVTVSLVDPLPGEIDQVLEVVLAGEYFRLEAGHLTGGSRCLALGPATDHSSHGGIEAEASGVVDILVAGRRL
jgi:hypothetical protein